MLARVLEPSHRQREGCRKSDQNGEPDSQGGKQQKLPKEIAEADAGAASNTTLDGGTQEVFSGGTINGATIRESLIADGCVIEPGAVIENSVIGLRTHIRKNVVIRNSVLFGSDEYDSPDLANDQIPLGIGEGTHIEGSIIETNCRIGAARSPARRARITSREGRSAKALVSAADMTVVPRTPPFTTSFGLVRA